MILCILTSCFDHYATSVIEYDTMVDVLLIRFTWRLVTHVRRRTGSPPRPRHDVAGPRINSNLFEAVVSGEAGLGGADVAARSGTIEEQPAT